MKPSDCHSLPLCSEHHAEQHRIGEQSFEKKYRFSMLQIAARLWKLWLSTTEAGRKFMKSTAALQVSTDNSETTGDEVRIK